MSGHSQGQGRPNIILITTDQQRWDALGCAGNSRIRTPNLDRLAREGVTFAQATSSCPVCVPARVSILSGQMPGKFNLLENYVSESVPEKTVPSCLNAAGYHTQAIGKMHFMPAPRTYGFQDMILSEEMRWVRSPSLHPDGKPCLDDYDRYLHERGLWGWEKPTEIGYNEIKPTLNPLPLEHHVTTWCGDRSVEYLKREHDRPFFLWTSFVKPHCPYDAPQGCEDWYSPADVPAQRRRKGELDGKNPNLKAYRRNREWHLYSEGAERMSLANYYANVTLIDRQIGRILDTLKDKELLDNTFILFTSDHGDMMGDHWLWFKNFGYEASMRIPMILSWPGHVPAGITSHALGSLIDVLPTVFAAAGCDIPRGLPGHDLLSVLSAAARDREFACAEIRGPDGNMQFLRTRRWKYIHYECGDFEELYDLMNDPHEFDNLAKDPAHRQRRQEFRALVARYLEEYSTLELSVANGDLKSKPFAPLSDATGIAPFSPMPWETRVPPLLAGEDIINAWWWKDKAQQDWTCMFDIEEQ